MLSKCLLGVAIACFVTVSATAQPQPPAARLAEAMSAIEQAVDADPAPGLVVAITDREKVQKIIVHGYADLKTKSPLTADSIFPIGSISKSFTAISLMQLLDQRRFDPNAALSQYLPEFHLKSRFRPVTGRDLLSHTSGIPNYRADLSSSRYTLYALRDFEPSYAPGTHYWYSNTGYQILGYALEEITGTPYHTFVEQNLLRPLGMNASYTVIDDALRAKLPVSYVKWPYDGSWVESPWFEYAAADASIAATAADMSAYARFFLNGGETPGGRILSTQSFALLTKPVLDDYAYGLRISDKNGDLVIGHSGSIAGFNCHFEAHMQDGFALVLLSNGPLDDALTQWMADTLKAAYRGDPLPHRPSAHAPSPGLTQYTGVYRGAGNQTLEFVDAEGTLRLQRGHETMSLVRMGPDSFRAPESSPESFPFIFGRAAGSGDRPIIDVSNGAHWYTKAGVTGSQPPPPPSEYSAYVGHYENHSAEGPTVRIFVRGAQLMALMDGEVSSTGAVALVPVAPSVFRPAQPDYNPERLHFGPVVANHAIRLMYSGTPLYRLDTP